jgi:hypothetical protein
LLSGPWLAPLLLIYQGSSSGLRSVRAYRMGLCSQVLVLIRKRRNLLADRCEIAGWRSILPIRILYGECAGDGAVHLLSATYKILVQ